MDNHDTNIASFTLVAMETLHFEAMTAFAIPVFLRL